MSFEDPFRYFELSQKDATAADVKRAYAKRLKVTRPDDDPAEFMRLRKNFESALNSIKWRDQDRANGYDDTYEDEEEDSDADNALADNPPLPPVSADPQLAQTPDLAPETVPPPPTGAEWSEDDADPFGPDTPPPAEPATQPWGFTPDDQTLVKNAVEQIRTLMDDAERRQKWSAWLAILDNEHLEGIDTFQMLSYRLRNLVCQETSPEEGRTVARVSDRISPTILLHLDDRFGWSKQTGTDWVTRNENLWISRLVETAASATGRQSITPWEKAQRELRAQAEGGKPSRFSKKTERMVAIAWIVARIALILVLINFIGYLLRE